MYTATDVLLSALLNYSWSLLAVTLVCRGYLALVLETQPIVYAFHAA